MREGYICFFINAAKGYLGTATSHLEKIDEIGQHQDFSWKDLMATIGRCACITLEVTGGQISRGIALILNDSNKRPPDSGHYVGVEN